MAQDNNSRDKNTPVFETFSLRVNVENGKAANPGVKEKLQEKQVKEGK